MKNGLDFKITLKRWDAKKQKFYIVKLPKDCDSIEYSGLVHSGNKPDKQTYHLLPDERIESFYFYPHSLKIVMYVDKVHTAVQS